MKLDKEAYRLEKFMLARRPVKASPTSEALQHDANLASKFIEGEVKEFDGIVYLPKIKMVYCSFYDTANNVAVLVPVVDLVFEDTEIQKKVRAFEVRYFS